MHLVTYGRAWPMYENVTVPVAGTQCAAVSIALGPISAAVHAALPPGTVKVAYSEAGQSADRASSPPRSCGSPAVGACPKSNVDLNSMSPDGSGAGATIDTAAGSGGATAGAAAAFTSDAAEAGGDGSGWQENAPSVAATGSARNGSLNREPRWLDDCLNRNPDIADVDGPWRPFFEVEKAGRHRPGV